MDQTSTERLTPGREDEIRKTYYGNEHATKAITDLLGEIHALRTAAAAPVHAVPMAWLLLFDAPITGGAPTTALARHGEGVAEWARQLPGSLPLYASPAPAPAVRADLLRALWGAVSETHEQCEQAVGHRARPGRVGACQECNALVAIEQASGIDACLGAPPLAPEKEIP